MPRNLRANENRKRAIAKREGAMRRVELGQETVPRAPAAGVTSMAVKARDPEVDRMVEAFLRGRK